ncbi:hypothetical protein LTR74_017152 [Friedmanniomyces endolithicus]|nr:hypothetical protein LTR74_017152 [Friedmanniomyces endolithicus]
MRAKAAEVADKLHVNEDVELELPTDLADLSMKMVSTPETEDRAPLGEIAPNSGGSKEENLD